MLALGSMCIFSTTHGMGSVVGASEMDHAIKTGEGSASTLTMMLVKFLLGEYVTTILSRSMSVAVGQPKDPIKEQGYLAGERHHL